MTTFSSTTNEPSEPSDVSYIDEFVLRLQMMEERFNQTLLNNKNHDENPYNKTIEEKVDELQATIESTNLSKYSE